MKDDLICWDSSVLISWLRGDEDADRNRATHAVVQYIESGGFQAGRFHSFDDRLLRLNGDDEVDGLAITACEIPGMNLPLS